MELLSDHEFIITTIVDVKRKILAHLQAQHTEPFVGDGNHFALAKLYSTLLSLETSSRVEIGANPYTYTPDWVVYEHEQHNKCVKAARNNAKR